MAKIFVLSHDRDGLVDDIKLASQSITKKGHCIKTSTKTDYLANFTPDLIVCDLFKLSEFFIETMSNNKLSQDLLNTPTVVIGDDSPNMYYSKIKIPDGNFVGSMEVFAQNHSQTWEHLSSVTEKALKTSPKKLFSEDAFAKAFEDTPTPPLGIVAHWGKAFEDTPEDQLFDHGLKPKAAFALS